MSLSGDEKEDQLTDDLMDSAVKDLDPFIIQALRNLDLPPEKIDKINERLTDLSSEPRCHPGRKKSLEIKMRLDECRNSDPVVFLAKICARRFIDPVQDMYFNEPDWEMYRKIKREHLWIVREIMLYGPAESDSIDFFKEIANKEHVPYQD